MGPYMGPYMGPTSPKIIVATVCVCMRLVTSSAAMEFPKKISDSFFVFEFGDSKCCTCMMCECVRRQKTKFNPLNTLTC